MGQKTQTASIGYHEKTYGKCIICGDRVRGSDQYITAVEGYTHRKCIAGAEILA